MELRIVQLPWLGPACALCSDGWMPTEVANAASARRIYETSFECLPVYLRVSASSPQPCVHDQAPHIQGLLRLWTGVRYAFGACPQKIRHFFAGTLSAESSSCVLNVHFRLARHLNLDSSQTAPQTSCSSIPTRRLPSTRKGIRFVGRGC